MPIRNEKLTSLIMLYTTLMDNIFESSWKINTAARNDDLNLVINESENRERLIRVFEYIQNKIEHIITNEKNLEEAEKELLTTWSNEVALWYAKTTQFDQDTGAILNIKRDGLTRDIATIFRKKEQHKGYDSSSVKK